MDQLSELGHPADRRIIGDEGSVDVPFADASVMSLTARIPISILTIGRFRPKLHL